MKLITMKLEAASWKLYTNEEDSTFKNHIEEVRKIVESEGHKFLVAPECEIDVWEDVKENDLKVFYIDVGTMSPKKAKDFLENVKNNLVEQGNKDDDFWKGSLFFAKDVDGRGSSIDVVSLTEESKNKNDK